MLNSCQCYFNFRIQPGKDIKVTTPFRNSDLAKEEDEINEEKEGT